MFKRDNREFAVLSDLQAIARVPAQVWVIAKMALIVWAVMWVAGAVIRICTTFHLIKVNKSASGDKADIKTIRPVYALFNFNITGKSCEKPQEMQAQ